MSKTFTLPLRGQFIAIHNRRGDFARICADQSCLNPLSTYAEKVDQIRTNLLLKHNLNVTQVLFASGEFIYTHKV